MDEFELLSEKVKKAAAQIVSLKKERRTLVSELDLLRKERESYLSIQRDNDRYKKDQDQIRSKLERIQKKLEKWTAVDLVESQPQ